MTSTPAAPTPTSVGDIATEAAITGGDPPADLPIALLPPSPYPFHALRLRRRFARG
jgi:hypothetical protein